jgi:hypothetical protein
MRCPDDVEPLTSAPARRQEDKDQVATDEASGSVAAAARRAALAAALVEHEAALGAALQRSALTAGGELRRLLVRVVLRLAALAPAATTLGVSALVAAAAAEAPLPARKSKQQTERDARDLEEMQRMEGAEEGGDEQDQRPPPPPPPPLSAADRVRILRLLEALASHPLGKMALMEAKAVSRLAAVLGGAGGGAAAVVSAALRVMHLLCNPAVATTRPGAPLAVRGAWDAAPAAEAAVAAAAAAAALPRMGAESAAAAARLAQMLAQYPHGRHALCRAALLHAAAAGQKTAGEEGGAGAPPPPPPAAEDGSEPALDAEAVRAAAEALAVQLEAHGGGGGAAASVAAVMRQVAPYTPSSEYHHGDASPAISLTDSSILLLQVAALGPPAAGSLAPCPSLLERFVAAGVQLASAQPTQVCFAGGEREREEPVGHHDLPKERERESGWRVRQLRSGRRGPPWAMCYLRIRHFFLESECARRCTSPPRTARRAWARPCACGCARTTPSWTAWRATCPHRASATPLTWTGPSRRRCCARGRWWPRRAARRRRQARRGP